MEVALDDLIEGIVFRCSTFDEVMLKVTGMFEKISTRENLASASGM